MTYTKKQFLEDVKKEAVALKRNATAEEVSKLNIAALDPDSQYKCIYGLATGHCRSERAVELISKCCKRFFSNSVLAVVKYSTTPQARYRGLRQKVNGTKSHQPNRISYVSTIETYITLPESKNKNLIDFLKGNRKDLVL